MYSLDTTVTAIEARSDWDSILLSSGQYVTAGPGEYVVGDNYPKPLVRVESAGSVDVSGPNGLEAAARADLAARIDRTMLASPAGDDWAQLR